MRSLFRKTHTEENTGASKDNGVVEKTISRKRLPEPVYYVESPDDRTVLVAMDVIVEHQKSTKHDKTIITWYDTTHERVMEASETTWKDGCFSFKRGDCPGDWVYHFIPMNLEIYYEKVKHRLLAGSDFTSKEDLIKAFLETLEDEV